MVRFHHLTQALRLHMRIDLRCRDVGMAQHLLHRTQVRSPFQKMACKAMAKHMRRYSRRVETCFARQRLEFEGEMLARQVTSRAR